MGTRVAAQGLIKNFAECCGSEARLARVRGPADEGGARVMAVSIVSEIIGAERFAASNRSTRTPDRRLAKPADNTRNRPNGWVKFLKEINKVN